MTDGKMGLQHSDGELDIVNGKAVERFLCIQARDAETSELSPLFFWLKMAEEDWWNRFFVEKYCAFWDTYSELDQDDLEEDDLCPVRDIGEQLGLFGKRITHVDCSTDKGYTTVLRIVFSSGEELRISSTRDDKGTMELVQH